MTRSNWVTLTPRQANAAAKALRGYIEAGHLIEDWIDLSRVADLLESNAEHSFEIEPSK